MGSGGGILLDINHIIFFRNVMTSHTQAHAEMQDTINQDGQKLTADVSLCAKLQTLENFAKKKYESYIGIVQASDDAQERFTSSATNFLHASHLIMEAVLRVTEVEGRKA